MLYFYERFFIIIIILDSIFVVDSSFSFLLSLPSPTMLLQSLNTKVEIIKKLLTLLTEVEGEGLDRGRKSKMRLENFRRK